MMIKSQAPRWTIQMMIGVAVVVVSVATASMAADGDQSSGPDIVTYRVYQPELYGSVGDTTAYALGTESCNRGDEPANWYSGDNRHPVIAQNLYRLKNGRLEQIGMSWLKHGFLSLNQDECDTCVYPPDGGSQLGIGCSDPYWASLNGSQDRLGPRHEVDPFTGVFTYPHSSPVGDATLKGRLLVKTEDVHGATNPDAQFFAEGQYVTADESTAGNSENSASYREQTIPIGSLQLVDVGSTFEGVPAIYAWQDNDPSVAVNEARVPSEGLFIAASVARDNGDGTWRYEYAVYNLNSHRSAQSFSVPIMMDAVISNTGFHDVDYHSGEPYDGTDWAVTVDNGAGTVTWATETFATNENANALRWGTMYNFWFDADKPPAAAAATIGLFRAGTPGSIQTVVPAPAPDTLLFADGFESGDTDGWSAISP